MAPYRGLDSPSRRDPRPPKYPFVRGPQPEFWGGPRPPLPHRFARTTAATCFDGLGREGRPHLVVVGLVPTDAWNGSVAIRPDTQEWPPLWHAWQSCPVQCHAIRLYRPGTIGQPSASRVTRKRKGAGERGQGVMRAVGALGDVADTNNSARRP